MNLDEKRLREFAYQIWESEGKPYGQATRHWEMACKLVAAEPVPADPMEPLTPLGINQPSTTGPTTDSYSKSKSSSTKSKADKESNAIAKKPDARKAKGTESSKAIEPVVAQPEQTKDIKMKAKSSEKKATPKKTKSRSTETSN
jgi:hypothetical protein